MKTIKHYGFTLVEIIIVVAVIGILASISLVSYSGVKERSRAEKASANAATVKKVVENYYSRNNIYPTTVSSVRTALVALPSDINLMSSANPTLNGSTGETLVAYKYVPTGSSSPTGACIYYWNFSAKAISDITYLGTATSANCGTGSGLGSTPSP